MAFWVVWAMAAPEMIPARRREKRTFFTVELLHSLKGAVETRSQPGDVTRKSQRLPSLALDSCSLAPGGDTTPRCA